MIVKQGRFYLRHNTLSEDAPIAIIFKVKMMMMMMSPDTAKWYWHPVGGAIGHVDSLDRAVVFCCYPEAQVKSSFCFQSKFI